MAQSDVKYSKVSIDDDAQDMGNPSALGMLKALAGLGKDEQSRRQQPLDLEMLPVMAPKPPPPQEQQQQQAKAGDVVLKPIPGLVAMQGGGPANLPANMQALLQAKLAALTPEQREVFEKKQAMMTKAVMAHLQKQQESGEEADMSIGSALAAAKSAVVEMETPEESRDKALLLAIRSGDCEQLVNLIKQHPLGANASICAPNDAEAHPLLHWAALNDQKEVVETLLANKVQLDQRNPRGEVALHWASLNGNIRCVVLLVDSGCDRTACDGRGYSAMHHAAQFGRTLVMAALLRRGLSVDIRDANGRTPLHWASYKGEDLAVQWLIEHGADIGAEDFEQCTALHWAALQGLKSIAVVLMRYGAISLLGKKDRTNATAEELSKEKMERYIAAEGKDGWNARSYQSMTAYLAECRIVGRDMNKDNRRQMHPTWFAWPVMAPIGFIVYYLVVLPETYYYGSLTLIFWVFYFAEWFAWIRLQIKDPGNFVLRPKAAAFKPNGKKDSDQEHRIAIGGGIEDTSVSKVNPAVPKSMLYRQLYFEVLDQGLLVPVCTTCEIVKPVRSKHDRFTDVCVDRFDHFCPFMGVAVGAENYLEFFFAMFNAAVAMYAWHVLVVMYTINIRPQESYLSNMWHTIWFQLFAHLYMPITLYATIMVAQHVMFISRNITTNEIINKHKYKYLSKGHNPFSKGALGNWAEFFGCGEPHVVDLREFYRFEFDGRSEQVEFNNRSIRDPTFRPFQKSQSELDSDSHGHSHAAAASHGHSHGGKACHGHG